MIRNVSDLERVAVHRSSYRTCAAAVVGVCMSDYHALDPCAERPSDSSAHSKRPCIEEREAVAVLKREDVGEAHRTTPAESQYPWCDLLRRIDLSAGSVHVVGP